ncbi:family 20 glycosylhydrolase [Daejeonella sp.]|uniref:family 20 glycosylhydrolase n=1 Tax=Daejeonella sp. TaxID=2805397 RepID=UPI0030C3DCD2
MRWRLTPDMTTLYEEMGEIPVQKPEWEGEKVLLKLEAMNTSRKQQEAVPSNIFVICLKIKIILNMIMTFKSKIKAFHFLFLLPLSISSAVFAQVKATSDYKLRVEWKPLQNNFEGQDQSLSSLNIINDSDIDLPPNGWTLYFNYSGSFPQPDSRGLIISYINGDLYKIEPNPASDGIAAKASVNYQMVRSGTIDNITMNPQGFYLVMASAPGKAIPVPATYPNPDKKFLQSLASASNSSMNPANVFAKNLIVKDLNADVLVKVFPSPLTYNTGSGEFKLYAGTRIYAEPAFSKEASYLASELEKVLLLKPGIVTLVPTGNSIVLQKNMRLAPEGYSLKVSSSGVVISASTSTGAFYGIQSLKTLLPPASWKGKQGEIQVPAVEVIDQPRFGYRSFLLDVSRNFQPKAEIIKILDLMSLYKLNALHLHFSDDEGWRVEIPSLPELTSVGSVRGHTVDNKNNIQPSFGSGGAANTLPGSGHYSRKDFIDILKYAAERHISIIPEIESPGHARAAIKSMENRYAKLMKAGKAAEANRYRLTESADSSKYRSVQGWSDNVINVALPSAYNFMERVTDDLIAMYKEANAPLKTIHFGGDEVPAGVWERSPAYIQLRKSNPTIKNTDDLWYYYFGKLNEMVKKRGLYVSGWEEAGMRKTMLDGKPHYIANPDFADDHFQLNVWNNTIGSGAEDLAHRLANGGYKVVLSPVSNQYFDLAYNNSYYEPGYKWGGMVDADKPFYFIPFDMLKNVKEDSKGNPMDELDQIGKIRLTDYGKSNIVGLQGLLWSENNINTDRLEYMMLPKLLGLAERAWSKEPEWATGNDKAKSEELYKQAWIEFANIAGKRELPRLSYYNGGYSYRIPEPGLKIENGRVAANVQYPGLEMRYTTDGSEPEAGSKLYIGPVSEKGVIKVAAFDAGGRRGRIVEVENR